MSTNVTLIRGDGIGPEVVDAAVRAVEATGAAITWEPQAAGAGAIPQHGAPLPEATLASIRKNRLFFSNSTDYFRARTFGDPIRRLPSGDRGGECVSCIGSSNAAQLFEAFGVLQERA